MTVDSLRVRMAKKKVDSSVFEIIVILSIVGMVAFTGQMLVYFEKGGSLATSTGGSPTGFVALGEEEEASIVDIAVKSIEVNPPSPLRGQSFEVKAIIANEGDQEISTPFYVKLSIIDVDDAKVGPIVFHTAVPQIIRPGKEAAAVFNIVTFGKEGAFRLAVEADPEDKLGDNHLANNVRGKTLIITNE
jgi:hypothetical protein